MSHRSIRTKADFYEVAAHMNENRRIFTQARTCGYAGVQHEDQRPGEEFRTGADYSPEYAEAMACKDIRRAGYGGIMREHSAGADHGTEADIIAAASESYSERCGWAYKEPRIYQPPTLISNEFRTESMSLLSVQREVYESFDVEPDPLDMLCEFEDEFPSY